MRLKDILARTMYSRFSPFRPFVGIHGTRRLLVLAYHRIDERPGDSYPYQEETVSATPEMFRRQLQALKRHCFVTTFAQLSELVAAGETLPRNTVIITFDDGYRDNYDIAWPILADFKLPAVIYLVTGNIDTGQPFWFDVLSYALTRAPNGTLNILDGQHTFQIVDSNRKIIRRSFGDLVRTLSDEDRLRALDELVDYAKCRDALGEQERMVLTWDEVSELNSAGIEIGSHTVSHPFLSRLTDEQISKELGDSKKRIEEKIGTPVYSLAYPTGGKSFYDQRVIAAAKSCGYEFGVSYEHDSLPYSNSDRYEIPRIHVELDVNQELFEGYTRMPGLFLKSIPRAAHR